MLYRLYGQLTMETILAAAFGSQVNILKGEGDTLTDAAKGIFADMNDPAMVWSELLTCEYYNFYHLAYHTIIQLTFLDHLKYLLDLQGGCFQYLKLSIAFYKLPRPLFTLEDNKWSNKLDLKQYVNISIIYVVYFVMQRNDFLQLLIEARAEDDNNDISSSNKALTDKEIIGLCFDFLLAGYETTSTLLTYTSYLLAINPDKQDLLLEAIDNYYQENEVSRHFLF